MAETPEREASSQQWPPPPPSAAPVEDSERQPVTVGWEHSTPSVSVTYQLTQDEVVRSLRWEALRNNNVRFLFACGAVVLIFGVLLVVAGSAGAGAGLLAAGGYVEVLTVFIVQRGPHHSWCRGAAIRGPQSFTLSDRGVEAHTAISESRSRWDLYSTTYETDDCYLVKIANRRVYNIIPKRAFRSEDDQRIFRELVTRHTKAHLRDPRLSETQTR